MKILILSASNPYKSAGIVALDLYNGLKNIKRNDVTLVVKTWSKYEDKNIIHIENIVDALFRESKRFFTRLRKLIIKKIEPNKVYKTNVDLNYEFQDYDQTFKYYSTEKILRKVGIKPDIIIVLFMQKFLSFENLYELSIKTEAPIFLYMMDMAVMTGGCHYAWDCKGYTKECGFCPGLLSNVPNDITRINYVFKKSFVEKTNIFPVAGTEWQFIQLNKSSLFKNKTKFKILCPINENQYLPADKIQSRRDLGLPINKKIIFFGAVSIGNRRKGFQELKDALDILVQKLENSSDIHIAIAGNRMTNYYKKPLPFSYTSLGYLDHKYLPRAFQAADVFVSPSIEDSGPMMVNQSIMCGTPVVSFGIGSSLDLVKTGETGYRANLKDSKDLAFGIEYILKMNQRDQLKMRENCRNLGLNLCHSQKQAGKLADVFNKYITFKKASSIMRGIDCSD